jgi:hypothetical protein
MVARTATCQQWKKTHPSHHVLQSHQLLPDQQHQEQPSPSQLHCLVHLNVCAQAVVPDADRRKGRCQCLHRQGPRSTP